MKLLALACLGGAIGAGTRHLINTALLARGFTDFPWSTFLINISGSILMGLLVGALQARDIAAPEIRVFLATGILGGYTTFSAFSLDIFVLVERQQYAAAAGYACGSVVLSFLGLVAGLVLAKWVLA